MNKYKKYSFFSGLKFSCVNALKANRVKLIITLILILTAISTGVFVAVKCHNNFQLGKLQEINLENFYTGVTASSRAFVARSFSLVLNVAILTMLAFHSALFPLAEILFIYRSYLFGLNFALIFIFYGIGSMFTAVIIILPCQMITIFALVMYYLVLQRINCNCKKFGGTECNRLVYIFLGIMVMLLINLAETLLLCLLSGKIILII